MADGIITPCNVERSWHWFRQVTAPCNVAGGSGMTCHGIRANVRHIGILHLVSILTISPHSTCHSAPICKILSTSEYPQEKKMTSCQFSRWRISAILDFKGPIMGSLKSPCTTSYRSPIDTIVINYLVFEKIAFLQFGDSQTDEQMDTPVAWSRSRCRERRLNKTSANKHTIQIHMHYLDDVCSCLHNYFLVTII